MSNRRSKYKRASRIGKQEWCRVFDEYYDDGTDPRILANQLKVEPSIVFEAIKKDKQRRAKRGLPPRIRRQENENISDPGNAAIATIVEDEQKMNVKNVTEVTEDEIIEIAHHGRKKLEMPENFEEVYQAYLNKEEGVSTYALAGEKLGVSAATFTRWVKEYRELIDKQAQQDPELKKFIEEKTEKATVVEESEAQEDDQEDEVVEKTTNAVDAITAAIDEGKIRNVKVHMIEEQKIEEETVVEEVQQPQPTVEEEVKQDPDMITEVVFEPNEVLKAGMISERHDIPVDKFVFDKFIGTSLMFDYDAQDRIAEKFVMKEIGSRLDPATGKRVPKKDLVLYATGIQCVLCSIIKVCFKYGINLTVMHYDNKEDIYRPQVVLKRRKSEYEEMFPKTDKLETLGCTFDDILKERHFYNIKCATFDKYGNVTNLYEILTLKEDLAIKKSSELIPDIMSNRDERKRITVNIAEFRNNREADTDRIFECNNVVKK